MRKFNKVIFLDEDNTRLSPITAVLFKQKMKDAGKEGLISSSRGNVVLFPEPVNQKIARISGTYGLDLSDYYAKELKESDFSSDNLILAMDTSSKTMAYEKFSGATNIYTLKEFLGSAGDLKIPIGGTVDEYATVIEIISGLLDVLVEKMFSEEE